MSNTSAWTINTTKTRLRDHKKAGRLHMWMGFALQTLLEWCLQAFSALRPSHWDIATSMLSHLESGRQREACEVEGALKERDMAIAHDATSEMGNR